jgi:hypothetical protein
MSVATRALDLSTRYFWRVVGRQIDINGDDRWLASPSNTAEARGDDWLDVLESAGRVRKPQVRDGLLAAFSALDGPQFTSAKVDDQVRDFYEQTASWQMEVWSQWNTLFAPGGELVARLWGRRVGQLALPVQPLESGSIQVFLTPRSDVDRSFWLHSRSASFGADGAYSVVQLGENWYAAQTPLRETFHVFTDSDGVLRTDHWLKLGPWRALQLHYRLDRR